MTTDTFFPSSEPARGGESPILDAWWTLREVVVDDREGTDAATGRQYKTRDIEFRFVDVEVIDALEPYPHPVADIRIRFSDPAKSRGTDRWSYFINSLLDVFGKTERDGVRKLVGKRQHWKRQLRKLRVQLPDDLPEDDDTYTEVQAFNGRNYGNHPELCWTVVEVEGVATAQSNGTSPKELALSLADGKTESGFYQEAAGNTTILRDLVVMEAITNRSFLKQMVDLGVMTLDTEGVYHKV